MDLRRHKETQHTEVRPLHQFPGEQNPFLTKQSLDLFKALPPLRFPYEPPSDGPSPSPPPSPLPPLLLLNLLLILVSPPLLPPSLPHTQAPALLAEPAGKILRRVSTVRKLHDRQCVAEELDIDLTTPLKYQPLLLHAQPCAHLLNHCELGVLG